MTRNTAFVCTVQQVLADLSHRRSLSSEQLTGVSRQSFVLLMFRQLLQKITVSQCLRWRGSAHYVVANTEVYVRSSSL